jgi:hypothetical protein
VSSAITSICCPCTRQSFFSSSFFVSLYHCISSSLPHLCLPACPLAFLDFYFETTIPRFQIPTINTINIRAAADRSLVLQGIHLLLARDLDSGIDIVQSLSNIYPQDETQPTAWRILRITQPSFDKAILEVYSTTCHVPDTPDTRVGSVMTPPTFPASQHEPNSCTFARVSPAVVQQPDPRAGISSDRNVHTDALCYKRPHQPVWLCDTSPNCLSQRRLTNSSWSQARSLIFALLCGLLFFCQSVQANVHGSSIFDRELVYDRRPMPKPQKGIYARQDDSSSSSATTTTGSSGILAPSSTSSVSESIQVATPVSTSLPRPFDTSIGNNFTESSCPQFFNNFLSNSTFQECLPFSMLLQVSMAWKNTTTTRLRNSN